MLVLSFINTGLYLLSELMLSLMLPTMNEFYANNPQQFPDEWGIMIERMLSLPQWYFVLLAVLDIASVAGLVLMWRLRKNGFHCYTLAKLMLMLMPLLFLDRSFVSIGDIMIGVLFIAYYFFLFKQLGIFDGSWSSQSPAGEGPVEDSPDDEPSQEN